MRKHMYIDLTLASPAESLCYHYIRRMQGSKMVVGGNK
jgi:hypothetical protein